jgi:phosphoglycolate phosphatase-like HAD superfamily hydrolase
MAVLFDLDQTLIDSSAAESHRRSRRWSEVYQLVPSLLPYEGVTEMIEWLHASGVPVAIVTSAPWSYCSRVIKQWSWHIDVSVCYHDTARWKPQPDPIELALRRLGAEPRESVSVGDQPGDIIASKAAGVFAIAAGWGCADQAALRGAEPDAEAETMGDLETILCARLGLALQPRAGSA